MNKNEIATNEAPQQGEKKSWVKPEAKTEQVSAVTLNLGGPGGDAATCHS